MYCFKLMCVAWGLEFLHNSGIIHGDLKGVSPYDLVFPQTFV